MATGLNGSFLAGATGTTAAVGPMSYAAILVDIATTGSVDVEEQMPSGAWIKTQVGIAADARVNFSFPNNGTIRLNVTANGSSIEYSIRPGDHI